MIELTYKENVEDYISNNLEILESSLDKAAQKYLSLKSKKKSLDFGERLTPQKLDGIASVVIAKTMNFLEIKQSTDVNLSMFYLPDQIKRSLKVTAGTFTIASLVGSLDGLTIQDLILSGTIAVLFGAGTMLLTLQMYTGSSFDWKNDRMFISWDKTANAVGSIAHEYTHCLQHKFTQLDMKTRNPIIEGHARGLEGIISEKFAQELDNPAYVFVHSDRVAKELKDAYLYTCEKKKTVPKKSLKKLPIPGIRGLLYGTFGHHYSIGVAAMTIASFKHGEKVYKDVMKNDFEFLRNP